MNNLSKQIIQLSGAACAALAIAGCAVKPHSDELKYKPLQRDLTPIQVDHRSSYIREMSPQEALQQVRINFVGQISLIDVLRKQLPDTNIMPADANVDLTKTVAVHAKNMHAMDFLNYLSSLTGYDIALENHQVVVRSFVRKQWNLAIFSSKRNINLQVGKSFSSDTGGGTNTFTGKFSDDEWSIISEGAQRILGVTEAGEKAGLSPFVQGVRSIGLLSVGGEPHKVKAVDEFITSIVEYGSKQINISVQAYEVKLNDKRGVGINWSELSALNASINGNPLGFNFSSKPVDGLMDMFSSKIDYQSSSVKASAIVNFLSKFGDVELLNQPNVTVRNGTYAYISAGEELTYVGQIEIKDDVNGRDKTTAKVESIRIGVTLSVAPRILKDGRILLEIWPTISSVDLKNQVANGPGEGLVLPKIQLQELATEVITESGRPVQLGGFIHRAISNSLAELPWHERITGKILNPIFRSETADLERTELVLTVTPTIVEGV